MYTHTYILESAYIDSERVRERRREAGTRPQPWACSLHNKAPGRHGLVVPRPKHQAAAVGFLCSEAKRQAAAMALLCLEPEAQAVAVVWPLLRAKHQAAAVGLLRCDGQAAAVTARNRQAAAVAFDETACMNGRSSSHTSIYIYIYIFICYIYLCLGFGGSGFGGLGLGGIPIRPSLKAPWRPKRLQA